MDYQGGWAYTAPSAITPELTKAVYGDPMQEYRKQQAEIQRQKLADTEAQRRLNNQNKATKFVNDSTDVKQHPEYATGTAADPIINGQLKDVHDKWAKMISDNPNMSEADIEAGMDADMGKISQTSTSIKAARQRIEDGVAGYDKIPGAKTINLKENAIDRMLYDTDANGKKVLRDKIDPTKDYVGDEIHENAGKYVNGDAALDDVFSREDKQRSPITDVERTDKAGVKIQSGMKGTIAPYQHVIYDNNGKITGVATNSEQAIDPDTKKPIPGMQVVDDQTFAKFNTPGMMIRLKGDVDQMLKDANIDPKAVDPTSPKYHMFLKHAMLLAIDKNAKKDIIPVENQGNSAARDKVEMAQTIGTSMGKAMSESQIAKQKELMGTKYGVLLDAANGDKDILSAGVPETVTVYNKGDKVYGGGTKKHLVNITKVVSGIDTRDDWKTATGSYNKISEIYADPNEPGTIYTMEHDYKTPNDTEDGATHLVKHSAKDIQALMRQNWKENGYKSITDVESIINNKPVKEQPKQEVKQGTTLDKYKKKVADIVGTKSTLP